MSLKVAATVLCLCVGSVYLHEAYPPGIPPPNHDHHRAPGGHQGQDLKFQGGQGQQQAQQQGQYQYDANNVQQMQQQGQGQQFQQGQGQQQQFQQGQGQQQFQQGQGQQQQFQQGQGQPQGHGHQHQGQGQQGHQHGQGGGFRQHHEVHNAEHIKEHLKDVVDTPKEEMSEEELEFHYFKLHDYDGNNKLDGIEITKAITHFHNEPEKAEQEKPEATEEEESQKPEAHQKVFTDSELENIVNLVLKEDDLNNDGYVEYAEFVAAQRKNQQDQNKENN